MAQGDKRSYSSKQKRKAGHIEKSYRRRGVSKKVAEERAWRTVNKQDGGAKGKRSTTRRKSSASTSRKSTGTRKRSDGKRKKK